MSKLLCWFIANLSYIDRTDPDSCIWSLANLFLIFHYFVSQNLEKLPQNPRQTLITPPQTLHIQILLFLLFFGSDVKLVRDSEQVNSTEKENLQTSWSQLLCKLLCNTGRIPHNQISGNTFHTYDIQIWSLFHSLNIKRD